MGKLYLMFSLEELIMRIENLLSLKKGAPASTTEAVIKIGEYIFDEQKLELVFKKETKKLTHQ